MKPLFLSIEGCDGSGKSTAIDYINTYLQQRGRRTIVLRAMGSGIVGEKVRECLFDHYLTDTIAAVACATAILDAYKNAYEYLNNGVSVIMDRGVPTYFAYNVIANKDPGAGIILSQLLNSNVLIPRKPDKTFYIDIDAEQAINRIQIRQGELTHLDTKPIEYFETVIKSLVDFLSTYPQYHGWLIDNRKDVTSMQKQLSINLDNLL